MDIRALPHCARWGYSSPEMGGGDPRDGVAEG